MESIPNPLMSFNSSSKISQYLIYRIAQEYRAMTKGGTQRYFRASNLKTKRPRIHTLINKDIIKDLCYVNEIAGDSRIHAGS